MKGLLSLLLVACASAPAPVSAPASADPSPSQTASPPPSTTSSATPVNVNAPSTDLTVRLRKRTPVTCNAKQENVPCVYEKAGACFLRSSNCDHKPCTEGAHQPTSCDAVIKSLAKPMRVCLDIVGGKDLVARVFHEDSLSDAPYGPIPNDHVRLCSNDPADRPWTLDDIGTLDWTKDACFTFDAKARALKAGCGTYSGNVVEGRL